MKRPKTGRSAWHVFTRGPRRLVLFHDDQDYLRFLSILAFALQASGAALWGYVLMPNHYHFMIEATSEELTACMRRLNRMYAVYYNHRYRQYGHSFDGPYKAHRQKGIFFILKRLAYIFLNPVVGELATLPEGYRWSSYRNYLGVTGSALDVDPSPVYSLLPGRPSDGLDMFLNTMEKESHRPQKKNDSVPPVMAALADQFEWLLDHARLQGDTIGGEPSETVAFHWAKECGIPPRAMAYALGEFSTGRIRSALLRIELKLKEDPGLALRFPVP